MTTNLSAILDTIAATIRSDFDITEKECGVQADHRPPPRAGQFYISVYPDGFVVNDTPRTTDLEFKVGIGITQRTGVHPPDRRQQLIQKQGVGCYWWMERLIVRLKQLRYSINVNANIALGFEGCPGKGFMEPLRFSKSTTIRAAGPTHFHASPEDQKGRKNCDDWGYYGLLPLHGIRYLERFDPTEDADDGIGVMVIGNTFIVSENAGEPPIVEPPEVDWSETLFETRFSYTSGGGSLPFSIPSEWVAVRDFQFNWRLVNQAGDSVPVVPTSVQRNWMWRSSGDEFFLLNANSLERWHVSTAGVLELRGATDLGGDRDGKAVSWSTSANSAGGPILYVLGYNNDDSDYLQPFDNDGTLRGGFWVNDMSASLATKFHNVFDRGTLGIGFSLSNVAIPDLQAKTFISDWTGSYIQEIQVGREMSHETFRGSKMVGYFADIDGFEVWDYSDRGTPIKTHTLTQATMRATLGVDVYVGFEHAHWAGDAMVLAWYRSDTEEWYLVQWIPGNDPQAIEGPLPNPPRPYAFEFSVTPGISIDGARAIMHTDRNVVISTIPEEFRS